MSEKKDNGKDLVVVENLSVCKKREVEQGARADYQKYKEGTYFTSTPPQAFHEGCVRTRMGLDFQMDMRRLNNKYRGYRELVYDLQRHHYEDERGMTLAARRLYLADMFYVLRDMLGTLSRAAQDEWAIAELIRIEPPREISEEYRESVKKKQDVDQVFHRLLK